MLRFPKGKTMIYGNCIKIGIEGDFKSVCTRTDRTHSMILTMLMNVERHFAHTVHQTEGNTKNWRADPLATQSED